MPKKLNDIQRKEIAKRFLNGETPEFLSEKFGYTKLTILKHIKESIGKELFDNLSTSMKRSENNKLNKDKITINKVE